MSLSKIKDLKKGVREIEFEIATQKEELKRQEKLAEQFDETWRLFFDRMTR